MEKTIQKSTVSFSIYIQNDIQLDWEYLITQLDPRWTMKLQHLQTIQTSHCKRMSKTWRLHDMPLHSTETTAHQALAPLAPIWLHSKLMFVTDPFIFSASAKAWRQRQIKVGVLFEGPSDKTWFLKSREQLTFNWDMSNLSDSKHGKTIQKSTVSFSIYIQNDIQLDWEYLITQLDPRWTMKLQHLQTIQTSHCKRMSKTWRLHDMPLHSTETTGLGALSANLARMQIDVSDGLVDFKCLGQGLEAATDQGWRLVRGPFGQNLISEIPRTIDIQLRHVESLRFKTWKNNPEIHGFIQHLHTEWHTAGLGVFDNSTRSEMNDETTAPANHPNFS